MLNEVKSLLSETKSTERAQSRRAPVVSTLPLDDPEFREIVAGFTGKLRSEVGKLSEFWHRHDVESVGQFAHWLKGAAGTMGFREFTTPSNRLMQLARENNISQMESTITEILELVDATVTPVP